MPSQVPEIKGKGLGRCLHPGGSLQSFIKQMTRVSAQHMQTKQKGLRRSWSKAHWEHDSFTPDAGETNQDGDSQSQWREKTGRKTEQNTTGSTDKKEENMENTPEHKT